VEKEGKRKRAREKEFERQVREIRVVVFERAFWLR